METTQNKSEKMSRVNSKRKATTRQKKALALLVADGGKSPQGKILLQAGYSKAIAKNPSKVIKGEMFKAYLDQIDDKSILARIYEIAMDEDKRASLQASDMLLKLKDRYPAGKLKINDYQDEINDLLEG